MEEEFVLLSISSHAKAKILSGGAHTELKVAVRTCEGKAIHGIHRMPCGALLSHADGAEIRRNMRRKILCFSVNFLCAMIFDIRTKEHVAPRPLRLCVRNFTRNTQKSLHVFARIYSYRISFEPRMGTNRRSR